MDDEIFEALVQLYAEQMVETQKIMSAIGTGNDTYALNTAYRAGLYDLADTVGRAAELIDRAMTIARERKAEWS